jgi:hypothetical protein
LAGLDDPSRSYEMDGKGEKNGNVGIGGLALDGIQQSSSFHLEPDMPKSQKSKVFKRASKVTPLAQNEAEKIFHHRRLRIGYRSGRRQRPHRDHA